VPIVRGLESRRMWWHSFSLWAARLKPLYRTPSGPVWRNARETIAGVHGQRLREFGQVGIQRALDNHTMTNTASQTSTTKKGNCNQLRVHYGVIAALYLTSTICAYLTLSLPEVKKDLVTLLSVGAILATFGSAIGAIGLIWQTDSTERVRLNVDILCKDIYKQVSPWRRWPFLPRAGKRNLLDGSYHRITLNNPTIFFDVGTHVIEIDLPTVPEDFFDLPLIRNCFRMLRFRSSAHTALGRRPKKEKSPDTGLNSFDEYMAYECMLDTWKAILKFRVARYMVHLGSGLTIAGACVVTYNALM